MEPIEFTREIYWNVGHTSWTLIPMYLLTGCAIALLVWQMLQRVKQYKQGRALLRVDQPAKRVGMLLQNALLQLKVTRVPWPGLAHGLFFWGFVLLFIGTGLIVLQADFTDLFFDYVFLRGTFYALFSLTLDLAGLLCLLMLTGLAARRYLSPPEGLESSGDDALMHGLLFTILLSGFVIEGCRMAVTELGAPLALWSPVGLLIAEAISFVGEDGLRTLHKLTWWSHLLLVMAFLVVLPRTKFRHILTTSANYFFADLGPKGKLLPLDLEDEDAESFGAATIEELTWKDIFDTDACTLCQRCQDRCPAHTTGKPLSPMKIINQLGEATWNNSGTNLLETLGKDALWSCTTCRACQEICPAAIEHVPKIVELRRSMVLMEGEFPGEEVMTATDATEVNGNPLGMGYAERADWAEELGLPDITDGQGADVLYFVGCYGSFDKRNIRVAKSFIALCHAAGVKVGILGKQEKCCGEPLRKIGNEYLFQSLVLENVAAIKKSTIQTIVTTCPHCYSTLDKDYRDFGLETKVVHSTVFLEELLASGQLQLSAADFHCTYHDSCYLGRYNDVYLPPRNLIEAAGGTITEMAQCKEESFCCGAGGGRILAEEKLGDRINVRRVTMATETGATTLVSNCPFCLTMFEDGVKGAGLESSLVPKDVTEILAERV